VLGLRLCGKGPELDGEAMTFTKVNLDQLRQVDLLDTGRIFELMVRTKL
jgi:hypothetical protein